MPATARRLGMLSAGRARWAVCRSSRQGRPHPRRVGVDPAVAAHRGRRHGCAGSVAVGQAAVHRTQKCLNRRIKLGASLAPSFFHGLQVVSATRAAKDWPPTWHGRPAARIAAGRASQENPNVSDPPDRCCSHARDVHRPRLGRPPAGSTFRSRQFVHGRQLQRFPSRRCSCRRSGHRLVFLGTSRPAASRAAHRPRHPAGDPPLRTSMGLRSTSGRG